MAGRAEEIDHRMHRIPGIYRTPRVSAAAV